MARYRTTGGLLLRCAPQRRHKAPASLSLAALDAPFRSACLAQRAQARGTSARRRHARLAALPAFLHDVALSAPPYSALSQRVLAIPSTRVAQSDMAFGRRPEIAALLEAPQQAPWTGRRDRT